MLDGSFFISSTTCDPQREKGTPAAKKGCHKLRAYGPVLEGAMIK